MINISTSNKIAIRTMLAVLCASISFKAIALPRNAPGAQTAAIARSGPYTVSQVELDVYLYPKLGAKTAPGTASQEANTTKTAVESLLRLKAVEFARLDRLLSPSERKWLELSTRIARASALLDLEEVRALAKLNGDPKALRERAYEDYLANPARFRRPTYAEVSVLLVNPAELGFDAANKAMKEARDAIERGEDFDDVAKRFTAARDSDGQPKVRLKSTVGDTDPTIARWVFQDAKPAETYGPYVSGGMFALVKFHHREPPRMATFESVAADLMDEIRKSSAHAARAVVVDKLLPHPIVFEGAATPGKLP
jgi:hypothetical protein